MLSVDPSRVPRMLLAGSIVLVALSSGFSSPAAACSPDEAKVLWIRPADGEAEVPTDAVLRALVGDGLSEAEDLSVSLVRNGQDVAVSVDITTWEGANLADGRMLLTITPQEALLSGATYRLEVNHAAGAAYGAAAVFSVVAQTTAQVVAVPEVEVLSATDGAGAGEAACDWTEVRTFQLDVEPAQPAEHELDVLAIYRTRSLEDTWHLVHVFGVDAAGSSQSVTLRGDKLRDWGSCFVAVQVAADGSESEVSALACAPEPLQPDGEGDDTGGRPVAEDSSCRGCDGGAGAGAGLVLVLAGALARRRRG